MTARERAQAIIADILTNHLPRIKDGLEKGYVDENQILVVYDHAVRARVLQEYDFEMDAATISRGIEDASVLIGTEFSPKEIIPIDSPATKLVNVPSPDAPCGILKQVPVTSPKTVGGHKVPRALKDEIESGLAIVCGRNTVNELQTCFLLEIAQVPSACRFTHDRGQAKVLPVELAKKLALDLTAAYADMDFTHEAISNLGWKPHSDQLQCACGGLVKEFPASPESLLKCEQCGRVYTDEEEVFKVRKTETIAPQKCPDATYWTTGTLAGGTRPIPMETEINLNGRKTTIQAKDGKFVLTYDQIVRMCLNHDRGGYLNAFTGSDAELPHRSITYHHRVGFDSLPGERSGSLTKGQQVECTPGMSINCMDTSNA